jgi:threonine dehydrogenase-like Zn-dependent dehydrogenase
MTGTKQLSPLAKIIAVDLKASRLEMALAIGATDAIDASKEKDVVGKIKALTGGAGANYSVEATGNQFGTPPLPPEFQRHHSF